MLIEDFKESIAKVPVSSLVLSWGEVLANAKKFQKHRLEMFRDLIEAELLPLLTDKKQSETLKNLAMQDPSLIIDRIRSFRNWSVHMREDYVHLYRDFSEWMSNETFGYVPIAKDHDRSATLSRLILFDIYVDMLSRLGLREQILAKIFYLGGPRALEDVLSLKIEDIDFSKSLIYFPEPVSYPRHLFEDIRNYIEGRKKGFVFIGRDGNRISHTTPFRALKSVIIELKLDPELTFKDLTRNI